MSAVSSGEVRAPRTASTLAAYYGLLLRTQLSPVRVLGIAGLGAISILLGVLTRFDEDPAQAVADAVGSYGLGLALPLATLWLGTSVLGDLVEDRLLVYLWLKPVARWQVPLAAVAATASLVVPLMVLPIAAAPLVAGASDVVPAAFLAASLAALAYSGIFVAAGIWFRRAAWWGLAFVLLWENALAYLAGGFSRFTVVGWAGAVLEGASDVSAPVAAGSLWAGVAVLLAVAVVGWLVAVRRYQRGELD
jgi:ABC-2 type transport system permease protein